VDGRHAEPGHPGGAAAWDTGLTRRYGEEQSAKGHNVALAPTINILRTPKWGRAAETFGEDPYLTGRIAAAETAGTQSRHVIATPKHYAANNQELFRSGIDVRVAERTLREIYYPGFEAAVRDGGAGAVMCSYPRVNGTYACENPATLGTLKTDLGFGGFVMSDWGATHSTVGSADAELDMEMPGGTLLGPEYYGTLLKAAVLAGQVKMPVIDDKVRRILTSMFRIGLFDHPPTGGKDTTASTAAHRALARDLSAQGTVLLKNERGVLPLNVRSLAVIGDDAGQNAQIGMGGSAAVTPTGTVSTPIDGITARAGSKVKVTYARGTLGTRPLPVLSGGTLGPGFVASYYSTPDLSGPVTVARTEPAVDLTAAPAGLPATWSARWTATFTPPATGTYRFSLDGAGDASLYVGGYKVLANHQEFSGVSHALVDLTAGQAVPISVEYASAAALAGPALHLGWAAPDPGLTGDAVAAARRSDAAVVFVNDVTSEGTDRTTLALPGDQDRLIQAVAAANPRTVVVLNTSGPVLMPWAGRVAGVLEAWYPGQEDGNAIASVLFGDVDPAGRLPMTFPADERQGPAKTPAEYPGDGAAVHYDEGVLVGYRWYDAKGEKPLFPFGHGLSYTTFRYGDLQASRDAVRVRVTNTGRRAGTEVAQLYLGLPASADEPPSRLKGFQKVRLSPGQTATVTFRLDARALSAWDGTWRVRPGIYKVAVGSSSRDIRATGRFTVPRQRGSIRGS
jgi:beta-glucosidase